MVNISVSIGISLYNNLVGSGALHHAGVLRQHADTGVHRRLALDTGTDDRRLCGQKRNSLTLHVGAHQRAVRVVVLKERDHGGSHGEYHLRGYVHQVDVLLLELGSLLAETSGYVIVNEMSFLVQRLVRLCNDEVVLLVGGQVNHLVGDHRILRIRLIHHAVGSLHEAVLVHPRVGRQGVDQTDVRSLRSLDGTHTSVVGVVYVSHLESRTVSGQTARSQRGETSLVRKLGQRVVLVHELGQLGASEELLHRRGHGLDID